MIYSDELLSKLTELAKLPDYTPAIIARVLGIEVADLMAPGKFKDAYDAGKLSSLGEFNKKVVQLSNQGSGPAHTLINRMNANRELNEIREYYG